ncbi:MAG: calcium-binding EGF-like domain-containing protein [Kofleriaceae bacterium]
MMGRALFLFTVAIAACDSPDAVTCDGETCSGHGTCVLADGVATCECDGGYSAVGLGCYAPPAGPLADLPSPAGPHIVDIMALGDGEWLRLPDPAPDPIYGVGRGRSWGGRAFALAPELRGAFFTGEGVHAFVKPDGFGMDDIYFYDVYANRWIAVHPGNEIAVFNQRVRDGALRIDARGQLVDHVDQPIPLHTLIHAWSFATYDHARRRFSWLAGDGMGRYFMPGEEQIDEGLTALEAQRDAATVAEMSPWFYDVVTGRFDRQVLVGDTPAMVTNGNVNYGVFQYVPTRQQLFYAANEGVTFYDPVGMTWLSIADQGPRPRDYDHNGTYDSARDRIYMGDGMGDPTGPLYIYDVATATWTHPPMQGEGPSSFRTSDASIMYDTVNDIVTVLHYVDEQIYTFSPATSTWSRRPFPANGPQWGYESMNAFYMPELNAYFLHLAVDSEPGGEIWVYRHATP